MAIASPARPWWRRWFGNRAEREAVRHLRRCGYRILRQNYRCPFGEVDVIALDGHCVVFVEVRSSEHGGTERPAASVDEEKQRRISRVAQAFLHRYRLLDRPVRFDVVAVSWPDSQRPPELVHYRHAFEFVGGP